MNGFVIFYQSVLQVLVFIFVSYPLHVRSAGEIFLLDEVTIKTYENNDASELVLKSSENFYKKDHNIQLQYNGGQSYTIFVDEKNTKSYKGCGIFIVLLRLVGMTVKKNELDVILIFNKIEDAKDLYTRHIEYDDEKSPDYYLQTLVTLDKKQKKIRRIECLSNGNSALDLDFLPHNRDETKDHFRFIFYSTISDSKPPAVMFITNRIGIKMIANKPNQIALVVELGKTLFYFGVVFTYEDDTSRFVADLYVNKIVSSNLSASITDETWSNLFDK